MDLKAMFEKYDDEFLKFSNVVTPKHERPDMCAFIMLAELESENHRDMVSAAEHDEIYLSPDPELVAKIITEEQVADLVRCGVRFDEETNSFCMFT